MQWRGLKPWSRQYPFVRFRSKCVGQTDAKSDSPVCWAGFIGEHSYSMVVAQGRPDDDDMALATEFAIRASRKISGTFPID
jgi:hypothetical protein